MNTRSFFAALLLMFPPVLMYGQSSGPATPAVQKFTPAGVNNMVDLFSGALNYSIPVLQLDGGYPINISYTSGAGMNEEAGAIGLGWQLNIGRINRTVRGLPDDFKGDRIIRQLNQQEEWNISIGVGIDAEVFGFARVGAMTGLSFSNLRGVDIENNLSASIGPKLGDLSLSAGLQLGMSSNEGATISPNVGLRYKDFAVGMSGTISAMEGVKYSGFNASWQKEGNSKLSASFPLTMARSPFIPKIDFPTTNLSGSFKIRFGPELWGVSTGGTVYGQFTKQSFRYKERALEAYGYLYLQHLKDKEVLMDIGTEKEGPVYQEDKNLAISYLANDVFAVAAQGLTGTFRPFRKDIGINHNENQHTTDVGGNIGVETHGGAYYHAGFDITANKVSNYTGQWESTPLATELSFTRDPRNIPVYFRNMGEATRFANRNILEEKLGGANPWAFPIAGSTILPTPAITAAACTKKTENSNYAFQYLTAAEAEMAQMPMNNYIGHGDTASVKPLARNEGLYGGRKPHHISAITITKDDGSIYEFGIAAYNTAQQEVMFNVASNGAQHLFDQFDAFAIGDNTMRNQNGNSNYFTATETPPYAYAYLLTAVYSPDYIDLTGDGPTSDDFGAYTRFNYTRETSTFQWQTPAPFSHNTGQHTIANYNPGNLCDPQDDIASYVAGKKEIWTIHSIETKNYIAQFYTSPRPDGLEQSLDNNSQFLTRIDSIRLFARSEYTSKKEKATPVQSVYFTYNTALCENIPANPQAGGKLTLKKLAFTYDRSKKEKHSFYAFEYNNEHNLAFSYAPANIDSWGSFKKDQPGKFNNTRFPYAEQDIAKANAEAATWNLKTVSLPSGGKLEIDYEANDYAFVQDKPVMQMYKIDGFAAGPAITPSNILYTQDAPNCWMFVSVPNDAARADQYFRPGEKIYINAIVKAGRNAAIDKEQISGFFDVSSAQFTAPGVLAIQLAPAANSTNPISRAFWQKMRKDLSHVLNPPVIDPKKPPMDNIISVVKSVPQVSTSFLSFLSDYTKVMKADHRAETLDDDYGSFVRLYNPNGKKLGGGSRVKQIRFVDNWNNMTNNTAEAAVYGKKYSYTTTVNNGKDTISTGVATYEPAGNQENPFIVSTGEFNNANALAAELYYYKTEPFGESFFPAPSIGYSRVTVSDLPHPEIKRHSTGFEVYEFYTSKDFPTITKRTPKAGISEVRNGIFVNQRKYTASQGFLVEVNDMHGKLKAQKIFSGTDSLNPVSGIEYRYRTAGGKLDNTVSTIDDTSGVISYDQQAGIDYDFYIATTESRSFSQSPAIQVNLDVIPVIFGIPFPVPVILPSYSESLTQYKGITTTKLIYRTGLLDEVITYENGSERSAKNLLYDARTGQVVVNTIQTPYNKPQYKTSLPAWWFYPAMGPAAQYANTLFTDFNTRIINSEPALHEADVLLLWNEHGRAIKAWVLKNSDRKISLIDETGQPVDNRLFTHAKIIRTGLRNSQVLSGGEILSAGNPLAGTKLQFKDSIIDASAITFSNYWQGYYSVRPPKTIDSCSCNERLSQLAELIPGKIKFNIDGTIQSHPNISLDGSLLTIKRILQDHTSCSIRIRLDRNWETTSLDSAELRLRLTAAIAAEGFCGDSYKAKGTYTITKPRPGNPAAIVQQGIFDLDNDCELSMKCNTFIDTVSSLYCKVPVGDTINPYLLGILGAWRQTATHQYLTTRKYDAKALQQNQGFYQDFDLFSTPATNFFASAVASGKWKTNDSASIFDPHGQPVEALDALSIPNARLYGYRYSFPIATAARAHYFEIAADGFEDYDFAGRMTDPLTRCPLPVHFRPDSIANDLVPSSSQTISGIIDSMGHTGVRSLLVAGPQPVVYKRKIDPTCIPNTRSPFTGKVYPLQACDIIRPFSPLPGKPYTFSCWINEKRDIEHLDQSQGMATITFFDAARAQVGQPINIKATGAIVDNWQQANATFNIPANADTMVIRLSAPVQATMFVDDIRIHPAGALMKTYIYDPIKLRLMALLDENNYSTLYEYDGEGQLARTKKETEHGIFTIDEIRAAKPKKP